MNDVKEIEVMQSVFSRNDGMADEINKSMSDKGIFVVNLLGSPGAGKTSSLIRLVPKLGGKVFVIEGDIESDIDTKKLRELGIETLQINTGGACHLDAKMIDSAVKEMPLTSGFLFVENIGNLVCPIEFMIGEHIKMLVSNVTEGSDKPYKYPRAFEKADIILIGKCDLIEHVDFDEEFFTEGVRKLNQAAPIFKVSCKTGVGFDEVTDWITARAESVIGR